MAPLLAFVATLVEQTEHCAIAGTAPENEIANTVKNTNTLNFSYHKFTLKIITRRYHEVHNYAGDSNV